MMFPTDLSCAVSLMCTLLPTLAVSATLPVMPASEWHGDVTRSVLAALPEPHRSDDHLYLFGQVTTDEQWATIRSAAHSSAGSEIDWDPAVDWANDTLVYLAFDGATQMLEPVEFRRSANGDGELLFRAHASRRPESADGPVSLLLLVTEQPESVARVTLVQLARDGAESIVGVLDVR